MGATAGGAPIGRRRGRAARWVVLAAVGASLVGCGRAPASDGADVPAGERSPLAEPLAALESSDPRVRLGAVQALAAYLEHQRRQARVPGAEGAGSTPTASAPDRARPLLLAAVPRLVALVADDHPAVRAEAVVALGGLGADAAAAASAIRSFTADPANPPGYRQYGPVALARVLGAAASHDIAAIVAAAPPGGLMATAGIFALEELGRAAAPARARLTPDTVAAPPGADRRAADPGAEQRAAISRVLDGRPVGDVLADLPLATRVGPSGRYLVSCTAPQGGDPRAALRGDVTAAGAPEPLVLAAVRLAADGRVLDHRVGTLDADARTARCTSARAGAIVDPTRWPVLSLTYDAAYTSSTGTVVVQWSGHVLLEQMAWRDRLPTAFARAGDVSDQLMAMRGPRDVVTVVGAVSGVEQPVAAPLPPLNARFAEAVDRHSTSWPVVVSASTLLAGPFGRLSLEAVPWQGAPAPLPRFMALGFQAELDPAVAGAVSSLEFWRAQLTHPHMLIRLAAVRKLVDTGFANDALETYLHLLAVPSRHGDVVDLDEAFGPRIVPALTRVARSDAPVAAARALARLGRLPDGVPVVYDALDWPAHREAALEVLQRLPTRPDAVQAARVGRLLPEICAPQSIPCWHALQVLSRAGASAASAAPRIREVLAAAPTPYARVTAAAALGAVGDRDTAWATLTGEVTRGSDHALTALHALDPARSRTRLVEALWHESAAVADAAGRLLAAETPPRADVGAVALRLLADSDPQRRLRAVTLVTALPAADGNAVVARAVRDADPRVRDAALPLVAARAAALHDDALRALRDTSYPRRAEMARALGRLGPAAADALPALIDAMDSPDADLRQAAMQATLAIGAREMPTAALVRFADGAGVVPSGQRRLDVLRLMSTGGPLAPSALPFLRRMLPHHDVRVQLQVVEALARVGSAALPLLRQLDAPTTTPELRWGVTRAIATVTTGGRR